MTRDEMRKLLPEEMDREAAEKLLEAIESEIALYRQEAEKAQRALEEKERLAQEKAQKYDELLARYEADMQAAGDREREAKLIAAVEKALREKGAKSLKAAMALMDLDMIRQSEDMAGAAREAVEALAGSPDGAFLFGAERTGRKVDIGGGRFRAGVQGGSMDAIRRAAGLK